MKIIYGIGKANNNLKNTVLAIGVFDGLHRGHQKLIQKAVAKAKSIKGQAHVLTFWPHPVRVLNPKRYRSLIVSLPHRLKLIERLGVAKCVVLRFSKKFSKLSPHKFIKKYLVDYIQPREVFIGEDFRFGKDRSGTLEDFKEIGKDYGIHINSVISVKEGRNKIGSTRIRELIASGKLYQARRLLGRRVSIMGKVIRGDARGKTLGFPTANIKIEEEVLPPLGVYAVCIIFGKRKFKGMANIGWRPSFKNKQNRVNLEVHIFNFNKNLYGKNLIIEFIRKIRNEKTFNSEKLLTQQLKKDGVKVKSILSNIS